jgi:hypothetical protein
MKESQEHSKNNKIISLVNNHKYNAGTAHDYEPVSIRTEVMYGQTVQVKVYASVKLTSPSKTPCYPMYNISLGVSDE